MHFQNELKSGVKKVLILGLSFSLIVLLAACSKSLKDGSYNGEFVAEDKDRTTVAIEIKDGAISACEAVFYDENGDVKDENYSKDSSPESYKKAQIAVEGMNRYPAMLVELGNAEDIEAISGASISLKAFQEAVKDALEKAE